jgi:hypothetical protein
MRRSSGPDSLLIYTHKLRGISVVEKLDSASDIEPAALVKVRAGERMQDILRFAVKNKLTPIGKQIDGKNGIKDHMRGCALQTLNTSAPISRGTLLS